MGASLAILGNLLIPQLEQNNNPNSQVQHVLVPPTTMNSIPVTFTNTNKTTRKNLSKLLNLPAVGSLTKDTYQLRELKLRIIIPVRDTWTDPDKKVFQLGHTGHGNAQNPRGDTMRLQNPVLLSGIRGSQ